MEIDNLQGVTELLNIGLVQIDSLENKIRAGPGFPAPHPNMAIFQVGLVDQKVILENHYIMFTAFEPDSKSIQLIGQQCLRPEHQANLLNSIMADCRQSFPLAYPRHAAHLKISRWLISATNRDLWRRATRNGTPLATAWEPVPRLVHDPLKGMLEQVLARLPTWPFILGSELTIQLRLAAGIQNYLRQSHSPQLVVPEWAPSEQVGATQRAAWQF